MNFAPTENIRAELLASVITAFERRFYEPTLHGVPLRELLTKHQTELLTSRTFSRDLNTLLAEVKAYPIEFFHESERQVRLWKAIQCSFHRWNGGWVFQDVLPDGWADRAGAQSGARLLAVGGQQVDHAEIPKFVLSPRVQVTFQNPEDVWLRNIVGTRSGTRL